jgi:hypothetical protein
VAVAGDRLTTVSVDGTEMLVEPARLDTPPRELADDWVALPGFDEYMLGYKDRSMMLEDGHLAAVVPGGNGVFRSTLVRAGRVVATWTRTLGRKAVTVEVQPLTTIDQAAAENALQPYAAFVGLPLQVRWP